MLVCSCTSFYALIVFGAYFGIDQVTWTWKRQQLQGCSGTINLYYRKTVLEDIRSVLTAVGGEKLLQQFSGGCFGHLMRFVGGLSCNKALHELISREISLAGAREDEMWFHISGTNIRFAPAEYALVTGLHFGSFSLGSQEMLPEGGVCERFCGAKSINIKKLWERFNSRGVSGSAEDYLKVAHVLVLYLMVLGYNRDRIIDEWVWVLVEDLDSWNRFPWGAYSYQALIRYVSLLPKTRTGSVMKYDFYGPVWALQVCYMFITCVFISYNFVSCFFTQVSLFHRFGHMRLYHILGIHVRWSSGRLPSPGVLGGCFL